MEKTINRDKFMAEFLSIVNSIELTPKFKDELGKHCYFQKYKQLLQISPNSEDKDQWQSEREKVIFILTELTRETSTCNAIIYILEKSYQKEVAEKLRSFNKSLEELPFDTQFDNLIVTTVSAPRATPTNTYPMNRKSRGECIIINNVESPQSPNKYSSNGYLLFEPKGLERDTRRLKNVFDQLHFNVQTFKDLDAEQIRSQLTTIAKTLGKDQAFALFIITHGEDEMVLGSKACEVYRQINFKLRVVDEGARNEIRKDRIPTKEIVEIFSETNCQQLASKPKLIFFICCRINTDKQESPKTQNKAQKGQGLGQILTNASKRRKGFREFFEIPENDNFIKEQPFKDEQLADHTIICYTCAEGYPTYFSGIWGISYFTQAFTLMIAQYACDESLVSLLNRTFKRLIKFFEEQRKKEDFEKGGFAIEVRLKAVSNSLYFNPGVME